MKNWHLFLAAILVGGGVAFPSVSSAVDKRFPGNNCFGNGPYDPSLAPYEALPVRVDTRGMYGRDLFVTSTGRLLDADAYCPVEDSTLTGDIQDQNITLISVFTRNATGVPLMQAQLCTSETGAFSATCSSLKTAGSSGLATITFSGSDLNLFSNTNDHNSSIRVDFNGDDTLGTSLDNWLIGYLIRT